MRPEGEKETQEGRDREFLLGELVAWIGRGIWAVMAGVIEAVTE